MLLPHQKNGLLYACLTAHSPTFNILMMPIPVGVLILVTIAYMEINKKAAKSPTFQVKKYMFINIIEVSKIQVRKPDNQLFKVAYFEAVPKDPIAALVKKIKIIIFIDWQCHLMQIGKRSKVRFMHARLYFEKG